MFLFNDENVDDKMAEKPFVLSVKVFEHTKQKDTFELLYCKTAAGKCRTASERM